MLGFTKSRILERPPIVCICEIFNNNLHKTQGSKKFSCGIRCVDMYPENTEDKDSVPNPTELPTVTAFLGI